MFYRLGLKIVTRARLVLAVGVIALVISLVMFNVFVVAEGQHIAR